MTAPTDPPRHIRTLADFEAYVQAIGREPFLGLRVGRSARGLPPEVCAHCSRPVRGRSPADPQSLCRRERSVAWSGPECAVLVADWGHPVPCVDCDGLAGPELDVPGLVWLAAKDGLTWDAPEMAEAVTWD